MNKNEEKLTPEAEFLDQYLSQYKRCIGKKRNLERRQRDIIREFNHPLSGVSYDGMPHGNGVSVGCAAISYRLDEINTRIEEQKAKSVKVLAEIMNVIDFLPENSTERSVIEHKYIDRMNWKRICMEEHLSRTPATRYWRKGLYKLLEYKKVQKILKEYADNEDRV